MTIKNVLRGTVAVFLAVCLLSGCAGETGTASGMNSEKTVTLTEPVDVVALQTDKRFDLMDLSYYLVGVTEVGDLNTSGTSFVRDFDGEESVYTLLEAYMTLLCEEYDFEQVGEAYNSGGFFDIVLRYTGDKQNPDGDNEGTFSKNRGDVMLYGRFQYGKVKGAVWYDDTLTAGDDGFRCGETKRVSTIPGQSAGAGLEKKGETYRTSDGRLSTSLGHAVMITDEQTIEYTARYEVNTDSNRLSVFAEDKNGTVMQCAYVSALEDWHDGFYTADGFVIEDGYALKEKGIADKLPNYTWGRMFATVHKGKYVYPVRALGGEMTGLVLRVMYRDEEAMVLYTCATFREEPSVVETLIAVSTDVEPVTEDKPGGDIGGGDDWCIPCGGSGRCSFCGGSGKESNWVAGTDEYLLQTCLHCLGSGKCSYCNG